MRKLLVMDTSTASLAVGAVTIDMSGNVTINAQRSHQGHRNHSIQLVPAVAQICAEAGIALTDFDAIAAGIGPGSYTGVRVGITTAKSLAWAARLPVLELSSLAALAQSASHAPLAGDVWYVPLMEARRGNVYTGLYGMAGECLAADAIRPLTDWMAQVQVRASHTGISHVLFIGDAAVQQPVTAWTNIHMPHAAYVPARMSVRGLGNVAAMKTDQELISDDRVHALVPNYTQQAQVDKKMQKGT